MAEEPHAASTCERRPSSARSWLRAVRALVLLGLASGVAGAVASSALSEEGLSTLRPGVLVVGVRPPLGAFQTGGARSGAVLGVRGFEVDVAREIAASLGSTAEFHYVAREEGFRSNGVKPWDIGLARLSTKRAGTLAIPYLNVPAGVLLRAGVRQQLESLFDLRWLQLCARAGTPGAYAVTTLIQPIASPLLVTSEREELRLLRARECDAAVDDVARLAAARKQAPDDFGHLAGKVSGADTEYAIALPSGSTLGQPVRDAVRTLRRRGQFRKLGRAWFGIDVQRLSVLLPKRRATSVTLIGDSVAAAFEWDPTSRAVLAEGLSVRFEALACRRMLAPSCGSPAPPTAVETLKDVRRLGDVVVMDVGYNDYASSFGQGLELAMRYMTRVGVRHVVWVTLREHHSHYRETNDVIRAAARRWPQITVADWNAYSAGRPWFSDGVHLNIAGASGLARFLRGFLVPHRTV